MEKLIKMTVAGLLIALIGYAVGRYVQPAKVEVRVEEKVKTVLVETTKKKKVKVRIVKPDGTIEERETEEDITITEKEKIKEVEKEKIISSLKPQWKVAAMVGKGDDRDFTNPIYGASVERRILGPIFVGGWATTDSDFGLSIGLEF